MFHLLKLFLSGSNGHFESGVNLSAVTHFVIVPVLVAVALQGLPVHIRVHHVGVVLLLAFFILFLSLFVLLLLLDRRGRWAEFILNLTVVWCHSVLFVIFGKLGLESILGVFLGRIVMGGEAGVEIYLLRRLISLIN